MIGAPRAARWRARRLVHTQFLVCAGERPDESTRDSVALPESHTRDATSDSQESRDPTANGRLGSDSCLEIDRAKEKPETVWLATKNNEIAQKRKIYLYSIQKNEAPSRVSRPAPARLGRGRGSGRRPRHRLGGSGAPESPLGPLGLALSPGRPPGAGSRSGLWHRHAPAPLRGGKCDPMHPHPKGPEFACPVLGWDFECPGAPFEKKMRVHGTLS